MSAGFAPGTRFEARAVLLGERIDLRGLARAPVLSPSPLSVGVGRRGLAVVFRYGAVALFEVEPEEERALLAELAPWVTAPFPEPATDDAEIRVDAQAPERPDAAGVLVLREASLERVQLVAHALARSALLAHYEAELAGGLERLEPLAERLRVEGRTGLSGRALQRQLGGVLATRLRMLGRAEVSEKPEMVWERPDLDRLYVRLADEYELEERERALGRKLDLLSDSANSLLEMLQTRRALHVEWYIVALIAVEIVILVYDMFWRR